MSKSNRALALQAYRSAASLGKSEAERDAALARIATLEQALSARSAPPPPAAAPPPAPPPPHPGAQRWAEVIEYSKSNQLIAGQHLAQHFTEISAYAATLAPTGSNG